MKTPLEIKHQKRRAYKAFKAERSRNAYIFYLKLKKHGYFLDCNYIPAKIVNLNYYPEDLYASDIEGLTLNMIESIYHTNTACSLMHCAPEPITKERAYELIRVYMNNSYEDYYKYLSSK